MEKKNELDESTIGKSYHVLKQINYNFNSTLCSFTTQHPAMATAFPSAPPGARGEAERWRRRRIPGCAGEGGEAARGDARRQRGLGMK